MENSANWFSLTFDPIWPWSASGVGWPALAGVALILVASAVYNYIRVPSANFRRIAVVLGLRLLALLLILLSLVRTSWVSQKDLKPPSILIVLIDASESMSSVKDEPNGRSRWEELLKNLEDARPILERLQKEHNIAVVFHSFGEEVKEFDPANPGNATGNRTDTAQGLKTLFDRYRGEKYLRGLLVLSDGADNVTSEPHAHDLAVNWRHDHCPVNTIQYGSKASVGSQNDIVVTSLTLPSVVSMKKRMTVQATVDALGGLVNSQVRVRVFINDKEVPPGQNEAVQTLRLRKNNTVQMEIDAPAEPGEIKVTLKVHDPNRPDHPLPTELTGSNNEMSTYVTVAREGLSVLLIERWDRFPEPQMLLSALAADKRIEVYKAWLRDEKIVTEDGKSLLNFDQKPHDVIILGDVTAQRLRNADPDALTKIKDRVENKRTGLLMMGGQFAFDRKHWGGTEIESILPVELSDGRQSKTNVTIKPTTRGLAYVMKLAERAAETEARWKKVGENGLRGYTPLGKVNDGSIRMAETEAGEPLLVGRDVGTGRTMAFAGDTTHRWVRPFPGTPPLNGAEIHSRFWRQVVLWLARQEDTDDNLRIRLDTRRLRTGDNLGFGVELRGKQGETIKNARYQVKLIDPKGGETPLDVTPPAKGAVSESERRGGYRPKLTGEYRIVATGEGEDPSGKKVDGKNEARFLAFQDDAEKNDKAANPEFLKELARRGGGQNHRPPELKRFLEQLPLTPLQKPPPRPAKFPDWQSKGTSPFLLAFILLFVQVLALEWFLRRRWGMV